MIQDIILLLFYSLISTFMYFSFLLAYFWVFKEKNFLNMKLIWVYWLAHLIGKLAENIFIWIMDLDRGRGLGLWDQSYLFLQRVF
jgi:hypothetical protein